MLAFLIVVVRALMLALTGHRELVLENLALRQQLGGLPPNDAMPPPACDRLFWMALARVGETGARHLMDVQPDTVIRGHRDWLRHRWTRRSRRHGRPPIDRQIRALVREMATAKPLWGAPRIHGELRTLGVHVSERTVPRLLESHEARRRRRGRHFSRITSGQRRRWIS
jgi:putative transposase